MTTPEIKEQGVNMEELFKRLLNRQAFPWSENQKTFGEMIADTAKKEAKQRINDLNSDITIDTERVFVKVRPRASSWKFEPLLDEYIKNQNLTLNDFLVLISEEDNKITKAIEETSESQPTEEDLINRQWVLETLLYETKAAIKRKTQGQQEKAKIKREYLSVQIKKFKEQPDEDYQDAFNRLVCQKLDELEKTDGVPRGVNRLAFAESLIRGEIESQINDSQLEQYLYDKFRDQKEKRLFILLQAGIDKMKDPEKALIFAAIMFEINQQATDQIWQGSKFEKIIEKGINGEDMNLISMLCCINQFDLNGGYTLVPDLFAYLDNPKLEPVPLIVDELLKVREFFEFYGIKAGLTLYVADTDYTEIGQFGPVLPQNIQNLEEYLARLKSYVADKVSVQIIPISSLTRNNPLYEEVKARVLENVTKFRDQDFAREWYKKFEEAFERVSESQTKRKLFPAKETRKKSLEVTRMFWAVNSAQGAVFGTLEPNTVLVSTERRERDQNYIIDKASRVNFPPVIYILKAAESWNRKLTSKID